MGEYLTKEEASAIFLSNIELVRAIAAKRSPARTLLDDIVQDTFVYFVERAETWKRDDTTIKGLLATITRNMAARAWNGWVRNLPESLQKIAGHLQRAGETFSDSEETPAELKKAALKVCMEKLSPEDRELLEMLFYGEANYKDAVQKTGKSIDSLYMRASRARTFLYDCITRIVEMEVRND